MGERGRRLRYAPTVIATRCTTIAALSIVAWLAAPASAAPAPADSSVLVIAGPSEPGTRLIVTGRVLTRDGRAPAPHQRVGVYHTDASGQYGSKPTASSSGRLFPRPAAVVPARLSGWL